MSRSSNNDYFCKRFQEVRQELNETLGELNISQCQLSDANRKLSYETEKLSKATKQLNEVNQKLAETNKKLAQSDSTLGEYGALLETGHLSDVVIVAGDHEFCAHKFILSFRSPVFEAMFQHEFKEKQEARVVIPDLKKDVCEELLRYMYTGKLADPEKNALDLLQIADKYQFNSLVSYITANITAKTASDILLFADLHENSELKQQCTAYIEGHFSQVKTTEEWKQLAETRPDLVVFFYLKLS